MAAIEIIRKKKSIIRHHQGLVSQQLALQACTTKINGVAKQCTIHRPLAKTPNKSDF
jgi:hypothetical protein